MKALVIVDVQNDFLPGGALAVPDGDAVIAVVNRLIPDFPLIAATQDWHPPDHLSFAANHPGRSAFEQIQLNELPQTLWPVHCVQNTGGALFAPGLHTSRITRVFPKGTQPEVDSYSGFFDNGHLRATGLTDWLHRQDVDELSVVGLATDYCVKFTVLDALSEGFRVTVVTDGCRGVDLQPGDCEKAVNEMRSAGAILV